jgi:broad specificity phosphatase PhoE
MKLYLVRHGKTPPNSPTSDPDLTEKGIHQADLVGERLAREKFNREDIEFDSLLCSPLRRSLKTADLIGKHIGRVPVVWMELMESWNGSDAIKKSEIVSLYPDYSIDIPERWWPGAENEEDLYRRAAKLVRMIRDLGEDTDRNVVAVSHGTFGAVLISTFLGAPPCGYTRFSQHNCCVSIIDIKPGRAKLYRGNDVSHLLSEEGLLT